MTAKTDSGPGFAHFTAEDTPADIERKMKAAFSPLKAMAEGWNRAFVPGHKPRDPATGRFVPRNRS